MRIYLTTNDNGVTENYLQSLVLLFMPLEKFGSGEHETTLIFSIEEREGYFFGMARLEYSDKSYEKSLKEDRFLYGEAKNAAKCFAGKLFLALFVEIFGYKPPWGILTGVRPARYALDFLLAGKTSEQTKKILTDLYLADEDKASLALKVALCDLDLLQKRKEREYSLYIGIPFCPSRCRYCSFVSYATPKLHELLPSYLELLTWETKMLVNTANELGLSLKSVYVGGGTPSVLSEEQMGRFLPDIRNIIGENDVEFTYEAGRPDTVTEKKLAILKDHGVTRLSINTQTTNDKILASVGRNHTFDDYKRAFFLARQKDFVINTDLIAGLPDESVESFCQSIEDVAALCPDNITVHSFTLKKSSEFTVTGTTLDQKNSHIEKMISYSSKRMGECGYFPYYMYRQKNTDGNCENVGFTKDEKSMALYNIYMMEGFHSVLAAGAGASTKLVSKSLAGQGKIYNPKYPYEYLRAKDDILKNREQIILFYKEKYNQ